jgi:hypothetical protein
MELVSLLGPVSIDAESSAGEGAIIVSRTGIRLSLSIFREALTNSGFNNCRERERSLLCRFPDTIYIDDCCRTR